MTFLGSKESDLSFFVRGPENQRHSHIVIRNVIPGIIESIRNALKMTNFEENQKTTGVKTTRSHLIVKTLTQLQVSLLSFEAVCLIVINPSPAAHLDHLNSLD